MLFIFSSISFPAHFPHSFYSFLWIFMLWIMYIILILCSMHIFYLCHLIRKFLYTYRSFCHLCFFFPSSFPGSANLCLHVPGLDICAFVFFFFLFVVLIGCSLLSNFFFLLRMSFSLFCLFFQGKCLRLSAKHTTHKTQTYTLTPDSYSFICQTVQISK